MAPIERYLLQNGLTQFNNGSTKEHLVQVMSGGADCKGMNIFKYTMKNFNTKPLLVNELRGGKIMMPMEYFGAPSKHYHNNVDSVNYSDITVSNIKQALPMNQMKGGGFDQKEYMRQYNANLERFVRNLKSLTGGSKPITKKYIKDALAMNSKKN